MEKNKPPRLRLPFLGAAFLAVVCVFIACLYIDQIRKGDQYRAQSIASNATQETVEASRGIITGRWAGYPSTPPRSPDRGQ